MLRSVGEIDVGMKMYSLLVDFGILTFSRDRWLRNFSKEKINMEDITDTETRIEAMRSVSEGCKFDDRIIAHSIRLLIEIAGSYPKQISKYFETNQFEWLKRASSDLKSEKGYWYTFKSSDLSEREDADIRSKGCVLYCWIKDREIDNAEIIPIRTQFRDLYHRPH